MNPVNGALGDAHLSVPTFLFLITLVFMKYLIFQDLKFKNWREKQLKKLIGIALKHVIWRFRICNKFCEISKFCNFMNTLNFREI